MERCGKRNAVNCGSQSWTGIGVVTGFAAKALFSGSVADSTMKVIKMNKRPRHMARLVIHV
jgi:hypothetical protein